MVIKIVNLKNNAMETKKVNVIDYANDTVVRIANWFHEQCFDFGLSEIWADSNSLKYLRGERDFYISKKIEIKKYFSRLEMLFFIYSNDYSKLDN